MERNPRNHGEKPESSLNNADALVDYSENEIFSQLQVPPETPFFVRLDGWRFQAVSEKLGAEKPFDERFAKCLVSSAKAVFQSNFNPLLIYLVSDELNVLFRVAVPFRRRVEKINSILSGVVSTAFALSARRFFGEDLNVTFDSRVVVVSPEKIAGYLVWRQRNGWRNHNNAYAYWLYRKLGYGPSEAAKLLEGLKAKDLHELLFRHGVNLSETPSWQRRGILVYKEPYQKRFQEHSVTRWRIKEEWELPSFSSREGWRLIEKILNYAVKHMAKGG